MSRSASRAVQRPRWSVTLLAASAVAASALPVSTSTSRVVMDDFSYAPAVVRIPADSLDTVVLLDNVGEAPHEFNVEGLPDGTRIHLLLFPETVDVPYGLPPVPAGEYRIVCTLPGHEAAGMVGTLVVG
ncbi:MAG: sulfocyanin-like copper-binding protein [Actinomycetes bacterium]